MEPKKKSSLTQTKETTKEVNLYVNPSEKSERIGYHRRKHHRHRDGDQR